MPVAEKAYSPIPTGKSKVTLTISLKGLSDEDIFAKIKYFLGKELRYMRISDKQLYVEYIMDTSLGLSETAKWFLRELEVQETVKKKQYKITKTKTGFVVMIATGKKFPPWKVIKGGFKTKPEAQAYIDKITKKGK